MAALGHDRGARVMSPQEARRQSHRQAAFAQIEFATDSPLEQARFAPSVPLLGPREPGARHSPLNPRDPCRSMLEMPQGDGDETYPHPLPRNSLAVSASGRFRR